MESIVAFVAYASADGFEFASRLVEWLDRAEPTVTAWIDRDNPQDTSFERRIEDAIIGSQVVLFVLTEAAVNDGTWPRRELMMAVEWEKPVLAVRPSGSTARLPLSGQGSAIIEMSAPDGGSWERLAHELSLLQPANEMVAELTDHRRELERKATKSRGSARIELRRRIGSISAFLQQEQRRAENPRRAARQVRQLIDDGQAKDAVGAVPASSDGSFRIVDGPPAISGSGLHDRYTERETLLDRLRSPKFKILTLRGPPNAGKTALVSDLIPRLQPLGYVGAVYVSTHAPRRVTPDVLFEKLARAHPDSDVSNVFLERIANRSHSWHQDLKAVMELFSERDLLLIIDNAEELLEGGRLTDPHMREFAYAILHGPRPGLRLLLVSRADGPRADDDTEGIDQVDIPPGLPPKFAEKLLRALDAGNVVGLARASEPTMRQIHQLTAGHPRALELIYAILRSERAPDLNELLRSAGAVRGDDSARVRYLIQRAIAPLNGPVRHVVQALAVYGRPVRPSAVSWLLAVHDTGLDSTAALELLCDRRMVRRDGELYYLPPDPDGATVVDTIPLGRPDDRRSRRPRFTLFALRHRAAEYFRGVRKRGSAVRALSDLGPHFNEIELRLDGGEYAAAAALINEIDDAFLLPWGCRSLVLRQRLRLIGKLDTAQEEMENRFELGQTYLEISRPGFAIDMLIQARDLGKDAGPDVEVALLLQLAHAYRDAGRLGEAREGYAAMLGRCTGDYLATARIGLAACVAELGEIEEAFHQYSAALEFVENPFVEAAVRLGLGSTHQDLGRPMDAVESIERAHELVRGLSDRRSARCLDAWAYALLDIGQLERARSRAESAIAIATDVGDVELTREAYFTLALANLLAGNLADARDAAGAAARFFDNQRPLAALALLGITQLRLGDRRSAESSFGRAAREADRLLTIEPNNVQVLEISGLVRAGLARCDSTEDWKPAIEAYQRARGRTRASGVVMRAVRLLEELLDGDRSPPAKAVLEAARGPQ
jgi:tetratricopeptide (TPR) repeat protein